MKAVKVRIFGVVQGVGFRASVKQLADILGLRGYVKNLSNGSVEAVFVGEERKINSMLNFCKRGPPLAKVERVEVEELKEMPEFQDFKIIF